VLVPVEEVRKLAESILLANGVPEPHARTQAGVRDSFKTEFGIV